MCVCICSITICLECSPHAIILTCFEFFHLNWLYTAILFEAACRRLIWGFNLRTFFLGLLDIIMVVFSKENNRAYYTLCI